MTTNSTSAPVLSSCACGCEAEVKSARSIFAPGHDARMVSQLVAYVVSSEKTRAIPAVAPALYSEPSLNDGAGYAELDLAERIRLASDAVAREFSTSLANKFKFAAHSHWGRVNKSSRGARPAKSASSPDHSPIAPVTVLGKVGRWVYDGIVNEDGSFSFVNKQGGLNVAAAGKYTLVSQAA